MRTSKISQDTSRIFNALSPNALGGRSTRRSKAISTFALGHDGSIEVKEEDYSEAEPESVNISAPDIEDVLTAPVTPGRKRKRGLATPSSLKLRSTTIKTEQRTAWTSPRKQKIKTYIEDEAEQDEYNDDEETSPTGRNKAKPKIPARKVTLPDGTVQIHPPSNWAEVYETIKKMRQRNPVAPVDTMGCEDLYWREAPPHEKRYHTLTALMLSSQTKDTVTAAAMQRLHTELVLADKKDGKPLQSALTIENVLKSDPVHLDSLIGKVGFHNNKTKFIKQAADILKREYNSDIPDTVEGLMRLPGVGPKMAYLCMSAAWGIDEGIGVDVHVHRITNLWGWHKTKTPEETRAWLEGWLPRDKWHEINKMLVGLGQLVCLPIGRRCGECDLAGTGLCKAEIRGWKASERRVKKETIIETKVKDEPPTITTQEEVVSAVEVKEELVE